MKSKIYLQCTNYFTLITFTLNDENPGLKIKRLALTLGFTLILDKKVYTPIAKMINLYNWHILMPFHFLRELKSNLECN